MKKLGLILMASLALVMFHDFNRAFAWDDHHGRIPLSKLAGNLAVTAQGSETLCFVPPSTTPASCSTSGAVPVGPFNLVSVGQGTQDKDGNSCVTSTGTLGFVAASTAPAVIV